MAVAHYESLPSRPDLKTALLALKRGGVQFPQDILGFRCHELREFLAENNCCRDATDLDDIYQFAKREMRSTMGPIRVRLPSHVLLHRPGKLRRLTCTNLSSH